MKQFLYENFIEPFGKYSDFGDRLLCVILWFLISLLTVILVGVSVWLIDASFLQYKHKDGVITKTYITKEHVVVDHILIGQNLTQLPRSVPLSYNIQITIDGETDEMSLSKKYWLSLRKNQKVYCRYKIGRLFGSLNVESFEILK